MTVESVDLAHLKRHVEKLSVEFVPRDCDHRENLDRAAQYIKNQLSAAGARVTEQTFDVEEWNQSNQRERRGPYRNVIGSFGPETGERVIVGAHYDAAGPMPGADDNASGVAGLLEIARLLGKTPPAQRVDLVAYSLEEPPYFATDQMGSAIHAAQLAKEKTAIRGMICLEMIGYFTDAAKSQDYPHFLMKPFYPNRGNFIAVVGGFKDRPLIRKVKASMRRASNLPVSSMSAPAWLPGIDFSDHRNYWKHGYPAVMITDTAFYRNKRYHTVNDTPDTLDYGRMAAVVEGVYQAVQDLCK